MGLLEIPREIRLSIFDLIVSSPVKPPASPRETQHGRKQLLPESDISCGIWQLPQSSSALSLLLVNKQINVETRHLVERAPANYHVDVMYLKDYGLWTTWSIPALPRNQYIESVHATFRLFEPDEDLDSRFKFSLDFQSGCGGPPLGVWSLNRMLVSLLSAGPGYVYSSRIEQIENPSSGSTSHYIVKEIIIDVLAPSDGIEHKSIMVNNADYEDYNTNLRDYFNHNNQSIPPETRLATYMCESLQVLLDFDYHSLNFGAVILEGVQESIKFLVNGQPFMNFNIEEMWANLPIPYFGETPQFVVDRQQKYRIWKTWVGERRRRMKRGLELDNNRPVGAIM